MSSYARTPPRRPVAQWVAGALSCALAMGLVLLSLPLSLVVLGLFAAAVGVLRRSLSRPVRILIFVIGLSVAVTFALVLADFTAGTTEVSQRLGG